MKYMVFAKSNSYLNFDMHVVAMCLLAFIKRRSFRRLVLTKKIDEYQKHDKSLSLFCFDHNEKIICPNFAYDIFMTSNMSYMRSVLYMNAFV